MKEKILNPISANPKIVQKIEQTIATLFRDYLYIPIVETLRLDDDIVLNSQDVLTTAIRSGRIYFTRGKFHGRFSAGITRQLKQLGATWDKRSSTFNIRFDQLPASLQGVIEVSSARMESLLKKLTAKLRSISPDAIAKKIDISKIVSAQISLFSKDFKKQVGSHAVEYIPTKAEQAKIAEKYTNNMRLEIKQWTKKEVVRLRKAVQESTLAGVRYEHIAGKISKSYGVSLSKAKFLASQETRLLVVHLQKESQTSAGISEYIWENVAGSEDHPVRPRHKFLAGKRFRWDNPPRVSEDGVSPVRYGHPGEDFNCRCIARGVLKFK